ncbi:uncharacterized protein HaLaN_04998 [Haematococcus lacustris]|uniref:PLAT domain-containing protein n=1 Tax=Haematococcus lacustris TaxID=44745 RepID=A0A699YTS3_HAELA|nr:uncharacterized protein HaLaN_04998 [Haematococcus lacustris]
MLHAGTAACCHADGGPLLRDKTCRANAVSNAYRRNHIQLPVQAMQQGKLGPERLDMPGAFDRGQGDVFHMEGADLGRLTKLVVRSDGSGSRPLWHLSHILVYPSDSLASSAAAAVYFPCQQWFDKEKGMTKELFPAQRELDIPKVSSTTFPHKPRNWSAPSAHLTCHRSLTLTASLPRLPRLSSLLPVHSGPLICPTSCIPQGSRSAGQPSFRIHPPPSPTAP